MRGSTTQPARRPAVITGASSGIGAATAIALASAGFPVALGARRVERCEQVAAKIRAEGHEAVAHPLDLHDTDSVAAFAEAVNNDLGDVEVVVSCAGAVAPGAVHEIDCERFARELDLNLVGAHRLVHAFVPAWSSADGATSSSSPPTSPRARPFTAAYAAGKWGLEGMAQAMQMELEGTGVRVSVVRPGPTWSEMGTDWDDAGGRRRAGPLGEVRPGPAPALPQTRGGRRRDRDGGLRPARRPPQPGRGHARGTPGGRIDTSARSSRRFPDSPHGHLQDLRTDPVGLLDRVREECGDVGRFRLADREVVLVTGADANEAFFRAPDKALDQAEAYPFMTPIFGKGVVFDATPEERQQMLKNQALRGEQMRGHAATIEARDPPDGRRLGRRGRDRPARLLRRADHLHHLVVPDRPSLSASSSTATSPRSTTTSSRARTPSPTSTPTPTSSPSVCATPRGSKLVGQVQAIITLVWERGEVPREERDLLDVLISLGDGCRLRHRHLHLDDVRRAPHLFRYGGWALIELLRHPEVMAEVVAELDVLYADGSEVSFQALRSIPQLEAVLKETLRLHPPLIILMRLAQEEVELAGQVVAAGTMVAASPRVSNRIAADFPDPKRFDPGRYRRPSRARHDRRPRLRASRGSMRECPSPPCRAAGPYSALLLRGRASRGIRGHRGPDQLLERRLIGVSPSRMSMARRVSPRGWS